jgi:anti-sigma regulatory factor (Ser/Thr protein kinase)
MKQTFTASNDLTSAVRLIGGVMDFLQQGGLNSRAKFIAELVLEEMVTNMVKYAFDDSLPHQILVESEVSNGWVSLHFWDDGHEFDPITAPDSQAGVPALQRKPGGRGLQLIRKLAVNLAYSRETNRNHLLVSFPTQAAEAA